jgi:PAS domain S-box-containing protein
MTGRSIIDRRGLAAAVLMPFIAAGLQWLLWPYLKPFAWVLFYPAVFFGSWFGGWWGGFVATFLSTALGIYIFIPPEFALRLDSPGALASASLFIVMGLLISAVHETWRRANRRLDLLARLQDSEASLKKSQAVAHVGHWTWDVRSNRVSWSDEMHRIFGVNPIDFTGDLDEIIRTAIHPDDREKVERANAAVAETAQPVPLEYRVVWPDGSIRTVYAEPAEATRDAHGNIIRLFGIVQDITERRQAEAALRDSEQKYSRLFEKLAIPAVLLKLPEVIIVDANEACERLVGYTRQEMYGKTAVELGLTPPQERAQAIARFEKYGSLQGNESRLITRSGETRIISLNTTPLEFGGERYAISTMQDITERRQAEAALRESEARLRLFIEHAPAAIAMFDRDLRYLAVSRRFISDYRLPADEIIGRAHYDIFPEIPERWRDIHRRCLAGAIERADDDPFPRADGTLDWVRWEIRPWREPSGEIGGILLFSEVVTERHRAEQRIRYLTRLYATLSQVNQTIVRVKDRQELFEAICQVAVEYGEFRLAWIGLLNPASGQVSVVAQHGQDQACTPFQTINVREAPYNTGLIGTALTTGRVAFSPDFQRDPHMAHWHEVAARDNYHAAAAIPIWQQQQVVGVLNLYAADVNFFEAEEEQKLLAEMGLDISFALDSLQREAERQQAEQELREREELLNVMGRTAQIGGWELDVATGEGHWTDEVARIHDLDPVTHPNRELGLSFYYGESRARIAAAVQDAIEHATSYDLELEIVSATGRHKWVRTIGHPVLENGRVVKLRGSFQDITERKQAEDKLRESEKKYRDLINGMNDTICVIDFDTTILDVNTTASQVLGYTREELLSMKIPDIDAALTPEQIQGLASSMRQDKVQVFETWHQTKDGRRLPVEVSSSLVSYGGRTVILSIARDITERKQMEERLRQSEAQYRYLFESNPYPMWAYDLKTLCFLAVNDAAVDKYGYTRAEFLNMTIADIRPPEDVARLQADVARPRPALQYSGEWRHRLKDGTIIDVEITSHTITLAGVNAALVVALDVTDRKQAEARIHQLNAQLEERVAQRTAELAAANERLTELDRLKSKFVSDVSHELRTPVTSLSLYIDLLDHGKPEKRDFYVTQLKSQMARLRNLIEDILDLSRLERDRDDSRRAPVDINVIVEHVSAMERGAAEVAGLMLASEIADNLPPVMARPDQLTRAITNLVSNAIKYTPRGSIQVRTYAQHDRVCVEVADTGLGIPADELPHLFDRFYRGRQVAQSTIPGTGLGLSIVKEIVESHGGTVEVDSEHGRGSTFRIWLPAA